MNRNLTPIATAVALLVLSTASAQAQQADSKPAKDDAQTVIVTGVRASLEQSLNQKRNAESHLEVITAEDIGKMPDKNVADSLQRVPGVTTSSASANEGGFDENDRVSMRGTNPSLTQTLINGHNVSSGDWFILNQTGMVGRSVTYTLLPSELVGKIEVHKTSEAHLVEGGVAGSVDIVTRKPLDFKNKLTAEGSLGVVYAQQPGKTDPQISGLMNWKNDDNTLGVMVQAFSEKRHLRRDGQELLGYEKIAPGTAVATAHPDVAGVWYPTLIGSALFEQERKRTGGLIDVQIKPSKDLSFDFSAFTSSMDASNYNRNYMLWATHFLGAGAGQSPQPGYTVRNGTLVSASFAPVAGTTYGVYDQISRPDSSADSNFFNLDAKWRVNESLTLSGKAGTSKGNGNTPTQDVAEWNVNTGSGASWGLNGTSSAANVGFGGSSTASPAGASLGWIFGDQFVHVKDSEDWGQIDGDFKPASGLFSSVGFGARWNQHERSSAGVVGQGPGCKDSSGNNHAFDWSQTYWCPTGTQSPADPANFPSGFSTYPGNYGSGLGGSFPTNVWYYTPAQLAQYNKLANRSTDGSREDWNSEFALKETNHALYVQGNMDGEGWSGNVGVRYVRTKEHVVSNVSPTVAGDPNIVTASAFGPYVPTAYDNTYTDILPSMNLRFDLRKDLVGRFALTRTMTRPDYSALAGSRSLSPPAVIDASGFGTGSGTGGNPALKPIRSNNLDASLEWYFAPRSIASAGLYYMDLKSYVGFGQVTELHMTQNAQIPTGKDLPYVITVPINIGATVKGVELAYETPIAHNFGVQTNYTYANASDENGGAVVGASKNTYNVSGYYEDDKWNARLNYTYRSDFYSGLDRNTAFSQAAVGTVSASLGFKINDKLAISFEGHNLNNPKLKYFALNEDQPRSIYQSGRQFYVTLHGKM
jgi:iron complex outermembrane recepter protein